MTTMIDNRYQDYVDASAEDRCAPRITMSIPATLRPSGVTGFAVRVIDLSLAGFAADAVTGLPHGSRCWLALPGLAPLQAEIMWNDGCRIGCAFTNLLSQFVLESIISKFAPKPARMELQAPSWRN